MGLDITAYRNVEIDPHTELDSDGHPVDYDNFMKPYFNPDFPGREQGLQSAAIYTRGTEQLKFHAGSYGGYGQWREQLAKLANYPLTDCRLYGEIKSCHAAYVWGNQPPAVPFAELVNFSDCGGIIGPVVSAKLAQDFAEYDDAAKIIGGYFYEKFQEWRRAFEMGADSGLVAFH